MPNKRRAGKKALPVIVPLFRDLFAIMDPGQGQDDEDRLVALNRFIRLELLNVMGVVANLAPNQNPAQRPQHHLDLLGQATIPAGIGTSLLQTEEDGLDYRFALSYLLETNQLEDGERLIYNTLSLARPKSIILLLLSGLTDAANVLRDHHYLFSKAVRRVVIMGGVEFDGNKPVLDMEGRLKPDLTAQNNLFDEKSARFLYKQLQDMQIPMSVITRHAATACKVPRAIYDQLAETGHPAGVRLRDAQKDAIQELWFRSNLPPGDARRFGLPDRCNRQWFLDTFTGGKGRRLKATTSIWRHVKTFNLYDPCTLVAAIPNLREQFFAPHVVETFGVEHLIIGVSEEHHNVVNPSQLSRFMQRMLIEQLKVSLIDLSMNRMCG